MLEYSFPLWVNVKRRFSLSKMQAKNEVCLSKETMQFYISKIEKIIRHCKIPQQVLRIFPIYTLNKMLTHSVAADLKTKLRKNLATLEEMHVSYRT